MDKKLKFGIIGTGNIFAKAHLEPLLRHEEVEITAICDINLSKAENIAVAHGIKHVYRDYEEMLKNHPGLDAIDICTPNYLHSPISIAALEAGFHVFCEKPDAVSHTEAQQMAAAAAQAGKLLMVMRNNRFAAASQYLKRYIEEGHAGELYTGRCGWLRRRGIPGKGGWFTTKELSGGGPLIDLGVHFIDLSLWLMGNPKPVAVTGATYTKFADNALSDSIHSDFGEKQEKGIFDVEDLAAGFIRFDNGASLQLEFSWASNINEELNFVELRGTKAGASIRNGELQISTETAGQLADLTPVLKETGLLSNHGKHLYHFIDCLQHRAKPINTPEQGVDMIRILSALYESAASGREVRL
ncbi:Gfo/Idh/MocA family oxidoreductase [Paenibacillus sp. S150]|uniref:Gfo/Idh/MocA family protein n=1 Tax=Paenibacillus sp. S150 TaxID=2749826 RepID=UPI001C57C041|nr:Gfo/Idh/MocA family oxidoreductase [Paenibacillus sp. S150]MBW4084391.1 Gfo/Idh/MocA family oxidoreductase [Paenibacillus sp. S150]